jgi:L-amino acid N-acyltransferase YncA
MLLMKIGKLTETHYPRVKEIYLEGIVTGQATFQTDAPSWTEWDNSHPGHSRIIAEEGNTILGWAALTMVSSRCVYAGVAEVSVYIGAGHRGKGVGDLLLKVLIESSEENQIWTLQAGIFPENAASLRLHEKNGFRIIGVRERIGKMKDTWRDTVLLERRSRTVGI